MTRGSWARFGIQETPYIDFAQGIYRYRFQGTMYPERAGYLSSADAGATFHYNLPSSYGDVHVGVFNGEGYGRAETNGQKGLMTRATLRPFAGQAAVLRGLRAHLFHAADSYVKNGERRRSVGSVHGTSIRSSRRASNTSVPATSARRSPVRAPSTARASRCG